ncbi:uncharacterized protein LOC117344105 [Pecten maximus]|uniref:uncharacterized protein LOC117344105 n=1 Tax=Pecten maximus TaxID=6579 RepID=UPI00145903ED|nr:uncharacterized protein LOC117344105 [Pecten maximus]
MTANASLEFYDKEKDDIIYSLTVVAPDNGTDTLEWWTNIGKFNRFDIAMEAFLDIGELPERPSYVLNHTFGIQSASISYTLTKDSNVANRTDNVSCHSTTQAIEPGVVSCSQHVPFFEYRLDHGDVFTMKFVVASGGYIKLDNTAKTVQKFIGKDGFKELRLKIDFTPPYSCYGNNSCGTVNTGPPLQVVNDITKDPVLLKWSGWGDSLSGLHSYVLEVFKLSGGGVYLLEQDPMKPTYVWTFDLDVHQHNVTPNETGMYSAILGVKDRANNTRYVRELFLYDSTSDISMEMSSPVHVTSASQESNYHWQIPHTAGKTSIEIDWTGHFVNKVHQEGGFLASVRDYPTQLKNEYLDTVQKAISTELRNPAAKRTSNSIPNINGIIRFELILETFLKDVTPEPPQTNWREDLSLTETTAVEENVNQGDCKLVWVRAYDIIGNNATDYGMVCFDASLPLIEVGSFQRDIEKDFFSSVKFRTLDRDSGIAMVKWSFIDNATLQNIEIPVHDNLPVPGNMVNETRSACDLSGECYCIATGECFSTKYHLDIDHCVLYQPRIENTETHYITTLTVYNQAMLNVSAEFVIENVQNLRGMDYCAKIFQQRLVESGGLTAGGIAGIVLCIVLIIAFVVFVLFLHKTGRLQKVKERSRESLRTFRRTIKRGRGFDGLSHYKSGGFNEEDIYIYGNQSFNESPEWMISPEDLTLNNIIVIGKFAKIYDASLIHFGRQMKVVAKTLKGDFTTEDVLLMNAKINFYGTKVGRHSCVLEMIGAIVNDEKMGPVMVLEHCGYGSVKDWLRNNKGIPSDSNIDFLFRFVYSIVQGMEYLASQGITHMRLAARNILLTDKLEPKISGFGPRHGDDDEDGERKERIPIKWIAPECMSKSKTDASEKSDVWSNGVVMWEIFSFGDTPYTNIKSADLPRALKRGERLTRPEYCDQTHYKIMANSWNINPTKRPSFREIREEIESMYKTSGGDSFYYANSVGE